MSTYRGPAALILDNGRELPVTADLTAKSVGSRTDWSGTLSVPDQSKPIEMVNLPQGRLRTGNGEGDFLRPDISDWIDSPAGQFTIRVIGTGEAPF